MIEYRLTDIIGPIMIGPSSSHTAGAARIGKMAQSIFGERFDRVVFELHGSFAETGEGHGTKLALIGGVLGFDMDDERLIDAREHAKDRGIEVVIQEVDLSRDLGIVHPNTVRITFQSKQSDGSIDAFTVIGSSIGGAEIRIIQINGVEVDIAGNYPTIVLTYYDRKRVVYEVSKLIADLDINIANLKVSRKEDTAAMVLELDEVYPKTLIEQLNALQNIKFCRGIVGFQGGK